MSRIRGRGNKDTELALAILLRANGITGWRRHVQIVGRDAALRRPRAHPGRKIPAALPPETAQHAVPTMPTFRVRPDFVFLKLRTAVFVDGCFWHGCPKHCNQPANNRAFWFHKLSGNTKRDRLVTRALRANGWQVVRIWEHELAPKNEIRLLRRLRKAIESAQARFSANS